MPSKNTAFRLVLQTLTSQRGLRLILPRASSPAHWGSQCAWERPLTASCQGQLASVAESCSCRDGGATNPAVLSLGLWARGLKHQQEEHRNVFHKESSCSQTHLSPWCVYSFGWYWCLVLSMFEGKIWDFILIICDTNLHCKWKSLINRLGD